MTASSPLAVGLLRSLGLSRVVVPRELSVDEIRAYREGTDVELEVFVHGALCVAWSGQCLSSEAWGGRSANRGQCAQACRLPYSLVVDGSTRDLGEVEYLLSPKDLVGLDAIASLADIGVASLKIEGRLKGPSYVATAVAQYRNAAARSVGETAPTPPVDIPLDRESLHVAYSRGVSRGFLGGADHQTLVEGRFPRHRGLPLGRIVAIEGDEVEVVRDPDQRPITGGRASDNRASDNRASDNRASDNRASDNRASDNRGQRDDRSSDVRHPDGYVRLTDVRAGMGVVFDAGEPEKAEQGGPIFAVAPTAKGYRLRFGNPGPDLSKVRVGDFVWVSSDPKVTRAGEKAAEAGREALGRVAVDFEVSGTIGIPLEVRAIVRGRSHMPERAPSVRAEATVRSTAPLAAARGAGISRELILDKLGALGGTPFCVGDIDTSTLAAGMHLPVSELKELRRSIVAQLEIEIATIDREVVATSVLDKVRAAVASEDAAGDRANVRGSSTNPTNGASVATNIRGSSSNPTNDASDIADARGARTNLTDDASDIADARGARTNLTDDASDIANARGSIVNLTSGPSEAAKLVPLCRNDAQLDAVLDAGADEVELDWMELVGLGRAVERAKARGVRVGVATVRVQKPGEEKIDAHLARLGADAVLVRSWGSLAYFKDQGTEARADAEPGPRLEAGDSAPSRAGRRDGDGSKALPVLHGDFSLNVTNSLTAGWVLGHGLETITAAHDLDREQLMALLAACPRGRVAVTIHHHIPTFHTEHCVYAHLLSTGRDYRTCGRPCEKHEVALRDRVGLVHPVIVDVGCRNTVFNAQAQSAATLVPELLSRGVRRFRLELVRENADEARRLYGAYAKLVAGAMAPADVVKAAAVHEQFGVTRGTMRTLTVLR